MEMRLKTHLEESEIEKIISACSLSRDKLIIRLLFRLGCRVSELVKIKTSDIDLDKGLVLIQHLKRTIKRKCQHCEIKVGKKHNFCPRCGIKLENQHLEEKIKQRFLPFDSETADLIKVYLVKRRVKSDRLISLTRQTVYYMVRDTAMRAGLGGKILLNLETGKKKWVSPHRFRDAFAIQSISRDNSPEGQVHLQQHLGHESFNTTAKYLKYAPAETREWYDKVWRKESETVKI